MASVMRTGHGYDVNSFIPSAVTTSTGIDPDSLYRDYQPTILRYVRRRVGTMEAAEDLVADVFLRATAKAPQYRAMRETPLPWLYRIAARRVVDHYRQGQASCSLDARPELFLAEDDPAEDVVLRETVAEVWRASMGLPLTQRTALWLCYGADLDMAQIAAVMGKSTEAAKLLVHRARRGVRAVLESGVVPEV